MIKPDPTTALYKLWVVWNPEKSRAKEDKGTFYSFGTKDSDTQFRQLLQLAEKMRLKEQWNEAYIYHNLTNDKEWIVRLYPNGHKHYNDAPATIPQH